MSLQQFVLILKARWLIIVITLVTVVLLIGAYTMVTPKQYTASASVLVDVKSPDPITGMMLQGMISPSYMNTQVDIIKSERTAKRVIEVLKLSTNPELIDNWQKTTEGKTPLINWLVELIVDGLMVQSTRDSNVITIQYTSLDAQNAAVFANAFAKAYLDVSLDLRVEPAKQFASFFDQQTASARLAVEMAQTKLTDYMRANGITSIDNRLDVETEKLNDISRQLTALQGSATETESKRSNGRLESMSEVLQNPLIIQLKGQTASVEAKLTEAKASLGVNHPQTQAITAELTSLRSRLASETSRIAASIQTSYEVNRKTEQQLKEALEAQRSRVLEINKQRDQIMVLQRELAAAERMYDAVSLRATQSNLESKTSQSNVSVLTEASAPTKHAKPNSVKNMFLAGFLGTLLGVLFAFMAEMVNRRVRSREDLLDQSDIPLLATIQSASGTIKMIQTGA